MKETESQIVAGICDYLAARHHFFWRQNTAPAKPGANNPVGLAWIGLSAKGCGIHGTPDPSKVSKMESNGCIRLTNWDVLQLASIVAKGTVVDFTGDEQKRRNARNTKTTKGRR